MVAVSVVGNIAASKVAEVATLLTCVQEVPGSKHCRYTDFGEAFLVFSSSS
jgi:hypothetical protein